MGPLLGCIADDFTGATDLAGMLVANGMRTVQMIGVPAGAPPRDADVVVVALKSRTSPVAQAVAESLAALNWLRQLGCRQFYFKYCSTFDSTPAGNIGPVADALMDALGVDFTIACPAFPDNGRTVYQGHLFVGDKLLSESGMQHHPLTPMTDSNLVRVLQPQTRHRVGLADHTVVARGAAALARHFRKLRANGCGYAVVDTLSNRDLAEIGRACSEMVLVTAGSGLAMGLPDNFLRKSLLRPGVAAGTLPEVGGLRAVVAGSCSLATQTQVAAWRERHPAFRIDPLQLARGADLVQEALAWAARHIRTEPVLVYATSEQSEVKAVQQQLGTEQAGSLVENALAAIAVGLTRLGVSQLIVAGGETSGAVVKALGVKGLRIGPQIDPGVPWTVTLQDDPQRAPLALALKSGNFGTPDFFLKAWSRLS